MIFLSKTTADYIIENIRIFIKVKIAENSKEVIFFTNKTKSTQDIKVHNQITVLKRFVSNNIHRRLFALIDCKSGKVKIFVK